MSARGWARRLSNREDTSAHSIESVAMAAFTHCLFRPDNSICQAIVRALGTAANQLAPMAALNA